MIRLLIFAGILVIIVTIAIFVLIVPMYKFYRLTQETKKKEIVEFEKALKHKQVKK